MADEDDRFTGGEDEGDAWASAAEGAADAKAADLLAKAKAGDRGALVAMLRLLHPDATDEQIHAAAARITLADLAAADDDEDTP